MFVLTYGIRVTRLMDIDAFRRTCPFTIYRLQSLHSKSGTISCFRACTCAHGRTPPGPRGTIGTGSIPDGFWQAVVAGGEGLGVVSASRNSRVGAQKRPIWVPRWNPTRHLIRAAPGSRRRGSPWLDRSHAGRLRWFWRLRCGAAASRVRFARCSRPRCPDRPRERVWAENRKVGSDE